jgi:hypothetical protein
MFAAVVAALFMATSATATAPPPAETGPYVITFDPGGSVIEFIEKYEQIAQSGRKVIIKGECISACTMVLSFVPPQDVCVTPEAMLAFHSASAGESFSQTGTQVVWYSYPIKVRELLLKHGYGPNTEHPELIWIPGTTFYHLCTPQELA